MNEESPDERLKRVEQKLRLLVGLSVAQSVVLAMISISYFIPNLFSTFKLIVVLALLGSVAFFFRQQIPAWFGNASRFVFKHLKDPDSL